MAKTYLETSTGFRYKFVKDFADDFEILEIFRGIESNPLLEIDLAKKLIGEEGYIRLKEHCTEDGRISTKRMDAEITEIALSIDSLKK